MTTLPANHPPVEPHQHKGSRCPIAASRNEYCPPQAGDSRSVCPALNAMANHGYIPRDGKNLSVFTLIRGLQKCYNLSLPLSIVLASGGYILIKRFSFRKAELTHFDKHNAVEHDASLVHRDCPKGEVYAPSDIVEPWVSDLLQDIEPKVDIPEKVKLDVANVDQSVLMNEEDVARSRIRREKLSAPLDSMHAEIARGEMAIILGVWERKAQQTSLSSASSSFSSSSDAGTKSGAPLAYLLPWLAHERLPEGWKPDHVQTLRDVVRRSKIIRETMEKIRAEDVEETKDK